MVLVGAGEPLVHRVINWNVDRSMCVKTLARLLTRRFGSRCIIALQEIQRWPSTASCGALAHGYRLIHDDGSACGFLLPLSAQKQLKTNIIHFRVQVVEW